MKIIENLTTPLAFGGYLFIGGIYLLGEGFSEWGGVITFLGSVFILISLLTKAY